MFASFFIDSLFGGDTESKIRFCRSLVDFEIPSNFPFPLISYRVFEAQIHVQEGYNPTSHGLGEQSSSIWRPIKVYK